MLLKCDIKLPQCDKVTKRLQKKLQCVLYMISDNIFHIIHVIFTLAFVLLYIANQGPKVKVLGASLEVLNKWIEGGGLLLNFLA